MIAWFSKNGDVITIRVGRAVEHVDTFGKDKAQVFDAVRWALISKDVTMSDVQIAEELQRLE